jgi:hypothetical protein
MVGPPVESCLAGSSGVSERENSFAVPFVARSRNPFSVNILQKPDRKG